ncbi:MAG: Gfo/Idh/MocA family oxidoreductase [Desulfofustis sp.]|nr:Gfo/Idh/MocA family oxidoreductase [Desulfofustis sp.]
MIVHQPLRILAIASIPGEAPPTWPLITEAMDHVRIDATTGVPDDLDGYDAVISIGAPSSRADSGKLLSHAERGAVWLVLAAGQEQKLPEEFGVQPGPVGPQTELRVMFTDGANPLGARLPDAVYAQGIYQPLEIHAGETETVLYVDYHYQHSSLLTIRGCGRGHLACTTLQDFGPLLIRRALYRLLRQCQGLAPAPERSLGIGILGYAPSVGRLHGIAAERTHGLHLVAACDLDQRRLDQAKIDFPGIVAYGKAAEMANDPAVDLVIVATAPNSHAALSIQMLEAGRHVLCEKPLALNAAESQAMRQAALANQMHLSCHQNRRWDPDFLAISQALADNLIGQPFYLETFVGGFHHPCGYWHSHAPVSGGTAYDWGAHYLDWIVGLLPEPVESVVGTRHKRVWHDVTNADQERIQIRFTDGREAEFIHSDIAATRKPKWYVLGTTGAIVGHWRDISAVKADPLYYYSWDDIPATEMMPALTLHRRIPGGSIEATQMVLPERDPHAFHANLADHLLWGEPLAAPLTDSMKVVAILEAAAASMAAGGKPEAVDGG